MVNTAESDIICAKFSLDSKEPTGDYQAFLDGEVRYNALKRANPEKAERLFTKNEAEAFNINCLI